jgi:hypothetical protein
MRAATRSPRRRRAQVRSWANVSSEACVADPACFSPIFTNGADGAGRHPVLLARQGGSVAALTGRVR